MSEANRWSIAELQAKYFLEPQLNDIFLEGVYDKEVLSSALSTIDNDYAFYEIDVVDVPQEVLKKYGLTSGNKQRIIALASELEVIDGGGVRCLVDRDLDHWFTNIENSGCLRWSKFCCIESHFMTEEIARNIVVTVGRARIGDTSKFFTSLVKVLQTLYAMRAADRQLDLKLKWVALKKYLSRDGDNIVFYFEKYAVATLGTSAKLNVKEQFLLAFGVWFERMSGDVKFSARGHDYTELLAWAVGAFDGVRDVQQSVVERVLVLISKSLSNIVSELRD